MGLDQYLEARKYISKYNYSQGYESKALADEYVNISQYAPAEFDKFSDFGGITISYPVGYWRKANAIHGWFVDNVQNGNDDCQSYYVPRGKLIELRDACKSVLLVSAGIKIEDAAATAGLLPTQGFFFGSYEMDDWYMEDLKKTVEIINHALSIIPEEDYNWSFYYQSSW